MIIKKLQNNFTTPEQSNRLLELGVPADSADCHYGLNRNMIWIINEYDKIKWDAKVGNEYHYLPCWSVGRLIGIFELCSGVLWKDTAQPSVKQPTLIERVVDTIVLFNKHGHMDFSKLEE